MIDFFKSLIKRNLFLTRLFIIFSYKQTKASINESNKRKSYNITDYKKLAADIMLAWVHPIIDNNYYGINHILTEFSKTKINNHIFFEHGVVLGSLTYDLNKSSFANKLITFGNYRKEQINKFRNYQVELIGPYIHYAPPILNEVESTKLKAEFGKTLLVFPSHSIKALQKNFDVFSFLNYIKSISSNYDTVLVCLFWKDIQLGRAKVYESFGFKVVTAGHHNDLYFLSRLKSIISLSDYTISNEVGTHIGYCIYMKKCHFLYNQNIDIAANDNIHSFKKEVNSRTSEERNASELSKIEFREAFGVFNSNITRKQLELVNLYWGIDKIKDQVEIQKILE